jgi:hypothetical protein
MFEFKFKETDKVLEKKPYIPELYNQLSEVKSVVYKDKNDKINEFVEFDSVHHLVSSVEALHDKGLVKSLLPSRSSDADSNVYHTEGRNQWTYGSTFVNRIQTRDALLGAMVSQPMWNAIDKLREGLMANPKIARLVELAPSIKKAKKFAHSGDDLDIDRVLSGDPNHWQYTEPGRQSNIVRIGINLSMSASHDEKAFEVIAALCSVAGDLVTKTGLSLEVVGFCCSTHVQTNNNNPYGSGDIQAGYTGVLTTLKKAEEPFDISRIACIGAPGFFRHYMFVVKSGLMSSHDRKGLGRPNPVSKETYDVMGLENVIEIKWCADIEKQVLFLSKIFADIAERKTYADDISLD